MVRSQDGNEVSKHSYGVTISLLWDNSITCTIVFQKVLVENSSGIWIIQIEDAVRITELHYMYIILLLCMQVNIGCWYKINVIIISLCTYKLCNQEHIMSELSCTTGIKADLSIPIPPDKVSEYMQLQKVFGPIIMKTQLTLLVFLHISTTQQTHGKNKMAFNSLLWCMHIP